MSGIRIKRVARDTTTIAILPSDLDKIKQYRRDGESLPITLNRLLKLWEGKDDV